MVEAEKLPEESLAVDANIERILREKDQVGCWLLLVDHLHRQLTVT